jgi:hypothetical protein
MKRKQKIKISRKQRRLLKAKRDRPSRTAIDRRESKRLGSGGVVMTANFKYRQTFGPASGVRRIDPKDYES